MPYGKSVLRIRNRGSSGSFRIKISSVLWTHLFRYKISFKRLGGVPELIALPPVLYPSEEGNNDGILSNGLCFPLGFVIPAQNLFLFAVNTVGCVLSRSCYLGVLFTCSLDSFLSVWIFCAAAGGISETIGISLLSSGPLCRWSDGVDSFFGPSFSSSLSCTLIITHVNLFVNSHFAQKFH